LGPSKYWLGELSFRPEHPALEDARGRPKRLEKLNEDQPCGARVHCLALPSSEALRPPSADRLYARYCLLQGPSPTESHDYRNGCLQFFQELDAGSARKQTKPLAPCRMELE